MLLWVARWGGGAGCGAEDQGEGVIRRSVIVWGLVLAAEVEPFGGEGAFFDHAGLEGGL
ncbi:MAG: hypothetical protein GXY55_19700 [Phycisphaerae bacterium]|nr:hypothetical protein [Phycisphaerae bacterium]